MNCAACGNEIRVVATTSCAKLKLDPDPVEDGDVVIGEIAGVEVAVRPDQARVDIQAAGIPMYRIHAKTCTPVQRGWDPRRMRSVGPSRVAGRLSEGAEPSPFGSS